MKNPIVMTWQLLTYFLIGIPLRLIYRVERKNNFRIKPNTSYVIAANHPKKIDSFLISYSIPLKDFIRLIPLRFMTAELYLGKWYLRPILLLYGCYTAKKTSKGTVLQRSMKLMSRGETIFIFPTGRLQKPNRKDEVKVGVAYLGKNVPNAEIIPVHIAFTGLKARITIKNSLKVSKKAKNLETEANKIYQLIT